MNERIRRLREQSLNAVPTISLERARLLTDFYASGAAERVSIPVARAMAFAHVLQNMTICINPGELIVGERGPEPKAAPTYPEICTHTLKDFDILHTREKISFKVDDVARQVQQERIIPFWSGRSIRDRIFEGVDPEWKAAYEAGVFTEFQEQRAPGHTVLDGKIYQQGFVDFQRRIQQSIDRLDFFADPEAFDKREELKAMAIAAEAIMALADRYADRLAEMAVDESDPVRKSELERMTEICRWVPAHAPRTLWEALQSYWFVHL
ncbi:MAG: hypothetical protein GYA46_00815 [candidate division Zixibacteria bacterium]|nr:hypothetical protein [candidate division Zixibacteria bacterium]